MNAFRTLLLLGLASALLCAAPAAAQDTATRYLQRRHEDLNRLLHQPATDDAARQRRSERLRTLLNGLLDYQELSRRALAEHWNERSPADRTRFVSLLQRLVERNYEGNLERILEFEVTYRNETQQNGLTIVHSSARSRTQRRQPPVAIDYAMQRAGDGWKVVDVTTDGVSMVDNYRSQFHRIIARDGWNELIARMQRRLDHGGQDT